MKRKIDDLGRIVLPAEMKKEIGLENGAEANIEIEDHKIIITKPGSIDYKAIVEKTREYVKEHTYDYSFDGDGSSLVLEKINVNELLEILEDKE